MSEGLPAAADHRPPDNTGYFAAAMSAGVALAFCVVLIVLLVVNAVQARANAPLAPAQIEALRAQLATDPTNEALRTQIRQVDHDLRAGYFTGRARALQGIYLLAVGVAVFLIASHLAASLRARLLAPSPGLAGRSWVDAALGLRSLVALALVMAGFLLTMLVVARHDASAEYIRAAEQGSTPTGLAPAPGMPDPAPGAVPLTKGGAPPAPSAAAPLPSLPGPVRKPGAGGRVPPPPASSSSDSGPTPPKPAPTGGHPTLSPSSTPAAGQAPTSWPAFRGPLGAWAQTAVFPTRWDASTGEAVIWKTDLALPGHNSPIVAEGRLFLTGADEARREVYCVDAASGKVLWTEGLPDLEPRPGPPKVFKDTGYAAPTMATDGQRAFAIFANGDLGAWDRDGKLVWSKALGLPQSAYGYAASLLAHADRLLIQFDQGDEAAANLSALIALDTATGKQAWKTPRPVRNSWSSPVLAGVGEAVQVVTAADPFVIAYDSRTGKELWRTKCLRGDGGPSPCYADGLVYVCSDQAGLFAIRTADGDGGKAGDVVWSAEEGLPDISSPVSNGEIVLLAAGYGIVTCYDAKQGTKLWEQDFRTTFQSSPVIVGKHVYLSDMHGATYIFEAAREYKAVGQGTVGEPVSATPAFLNGRVYLRGEKRLYCLAPPEAAP
jgi:outer membrane protein assembly factor BamB